MQTTTTGSCQIELFAGLLPRRKWSRIQPIPCPVCGVEFKPKSGRKYCSLKCSAIQIGRQKKGQPIGGSLPAWHGCAKCHAYIGMAGKMSGDLVNKDKATICQFRKEKGLPTLSKSYAAKSISIKTGKAQRDAGEQWWKDNWFGMVETYWDKCSELIIAKMETPKVSFNTLLYYRDLEKNRKASRDNAKKRYQKLKNKKDHVYWVKQN